MPEWNIGDVLHGFRVERKAPVPALNADYWKLTHEKTGATLYYSDRDDGQMLFSVGFRTLPENDTGVFHILEHSSLDGSEHFPLKEPFVNLMKTSLAVDLNAMTYEDKTLYYFISTDEQDYLNMMTVYLDAVFHPLLLSDRRIFEKEAWHLEPDGNGGLRCSGVVFNEMQGNDNNPVMSLFFQMEKQVFPDLFNRFSSGGDPAYIHTLTYEQFVETYRRFYGPDNAMIYLSGKIGFDRELSLLDSVLCGLDKPLFAPPAPAPLQTPVVSPDGTAYYQLADKDEPAGNTHLGFACIMDGVNSEDTLGMTLLSRYLTETTESPLSKPVLDAGVGMDFSMGVEGEFRQPMIFFMMGKSDPEHAAGFRQAILDTLRGLVDEGFDADRLRDILETCDVDARRASLSPRMGFDIMESLFSSHVQRGEAELRDNLAALRARLEENPRYFEELAEKYILNSSHWGLTRCVPSRTLVAEKREKMDEWLRAEADRLHAEPGAYEALEAHFAAFNEYLVAPDSPEAEASVPHLTPADITARPALRDITVGRARMGDHDILSLTYLAETNGMMQASLRFDIGGLSPDEFFCCRCLADSLLSLPAAGYDVPTLTGRKLAARVSMNCSTDTAATGDKTRTPAYLTMLLDGPEATMADALAIARDYMTSPVFDKAILKQLFSNPAWLKNSIIRRGNRYAAQLAESAFSESAVYANESMGVSFYHKVSKLADSFDEMADDLIAGMKAVADKIFGNVQPLSLYIGSEAGYAVWESLLAGLPFGTEKPVHTPFPLADRTPKAVTIPGEVNYCAESFDLSEVGGAFDARYSVVTNLINTKYFWDAIRAKGGAYGAGCGLSLAGILSMTSYRDPRVDDTFGVYANLPDWLDDNLPGDDELASLIVSTVSGFFTPHSVFEKGCSAYNDWLIGRTAAERLRNLDKMLGTTRGSFTEFSSLVRALLDKQAGVRAVIGGVKPVADSPLFDTAEEL